MMYYGERVKGVPHHIIVWYDRSIRIWWVQVLNKKGHVLDLVPKTEYMIHTFSIDCGNKNIAINESKELSKKLNIPIVYGRK